MAGARAVAGERRAVVTGGAGFVGSHLCERLLSEGYRVACVDNLLTGSPENVAHLAGEEGFEFVERDVAAGPIEVPGGADEVYHLASPASPEDFGRLAVEILEAGSSGTRNALELARAEGARFLLASSSEVYGDPLAHPQAEGYRGNVDPIGPRSAYDEAKRYAEAITTAYRRRRGVDTRIARVFNTHGPRMRPDDGRMVPAFARRALAGEPLMIHGDGSQTRSLQHVDDLVEGLVLLMGSAEERPVNIGNPDERPVLEIAEMVVEACGGGRIVHGPAREGDPVRRRPDIGRAREVLGWEPRVGAREGLASTLRWFAERHERRVS